MKVRFIFSKTDKSVISIDYIPFDQTHSKLWVDSICAFLTSKKCLVDVERVYNFIGYQEEFNNSIANCNIVIDKLNTIYTLSIPYIRADYLQEDVNRVHIHFVESDRQKDLNPLWLKLNESLHGLETIERNKNKKLQGQVFSRLPNAKKYDLPEESYASFTTKKTFGYCYANYPHVGRHILEMYNAQDEHAHDDDILPMHKIAGDFYLWFGNTTPWYFDKIRMLDIRRWFHKNKIQDILGMEWGNPRLAIGWLPVAEIDKKITKQDLIGLCKLEKIMIV